MTFQMSILRCAYLDLLGCGRHVTIFLNFVSIVPNERRNVRSTEK